MTSLHRYKTRKNTLWPTAWLFPNIPYSLFPIPCSLFPVPCSRFPIPDSRFPAP
ncbi:MAG: hypothetical protein F6J90_11480 [Moorea sp. SIOASIH]|uniref:hypothetical protein n=1 Tax=Moorena sp. SIOASIH TaxID=2607817 RepID=UPI0013BE233C|nr:hypothetical protein [Moorena sp. SIOASIH]NEO36897.1 hypothetical protein [Moorena sp. SIOASIH]